MQRPLILIVDPDQDTRTILRAYLEQHGYPAVVDTGDGRFGLELARRLGPDLIIGDFPLEVPAHSPFLEALREEVGSTAPVLCLTSRATVRELESVRPLVQATLTKPVRPARVGTEVDRLLNRL